MVSFHTARPRAWCRLAMIIVALVAVPVISGAQSTPGPSPTPRKHARHGTSASASPSPKPTPDVTPSSPSPRKATAPPSSSPAAKDSDADSHSPASEDRGDPSAHGTAEGKPLPTPGATSSIEPGEIEQFEEQPEPVRQLLTAALALTKLHLTYAYGSAEPAAGGLDCSGTIYYLLRQSGFSDVPRQASEQYTWVREHSRFYAVLSKKQETPELAELRPGDLLFWTGTYSVERDPPVTHTMIYLGRRKQDGHRLMVGASDGRTYDGLKRNGVSVFDFHLPPATGAMPGAPTTAAAPDHAPVFAGYGPIPGMADLSDAANRQTAAAHAVAARSGSDERVDAAKPSPTPKRIHAAHRPDNS